MNLPAPTLQGSLTPCVCPALLLPPSCSFRCYYVDSEEEEEEEEWYEDEVDDDLELFLSGCSDMMRLRGMVVRLARRKRLTAALAALGCELRSDSRLCEAYINHGTGSPQRVAVVMRVSGRAACAARWVCRAGSAGFTGWVCDM